MFRIVTQNRFGNRRFEMIDFNVKQMFDEWFCNVLVAKDEPEHDRVCDVKVVKGLYVHNFTSVKFGGSNLQRKILEKRCVANFANNRLQILLFCQQ